MKKFLLYITAVVLLASCDDFSYSGVFDGSKQEKDIEVKSAKFSDDYQSLQLKVDVSSSLPSTARLDDSKNYKVVVKDKYRYFIPLITPNQPALQSIDYVVPAELSKANFDCLVLIDLCQPAAIIQKQHEYVKAIKTKFCHQNLFLSFMLPDGKVTNIIPATEYVIDNYININAPLLGNTLSHQLPTLDTPEDTIETTIQHAYLYRSVGHVLSSAMGHSGTNFDTSSHKVMLIFSDGQVYNEDNMPIDPEHFAMQEKLINLSKRIPNDLCVYYCSLSQNDNVMLTDKNMMQMLCNASRGRLFNTFNANSFQNAISEDFNFPLIDYVITVKYKVGNILLGNDRYIDISFVNKKGEVVADCEWNYVVGSVYEPIVVGDVSEIRVFLAGACLALLLLGFSYIILQLIVPFILYRIFLRKYQHKYTGPNMSVRGNLVADTCYFCKAPFKVGEDIVAKCKHTMHLSCWEENNQHCPEHGKHCPEGSHYYNQHNLFDPDNGSYFIKWILLASLATFLTWIYTLSEYHHFIYNILQDAADMLISDNNASVSDAELTPDIPLQAASSSLYLMQVVTFVKSFLLTFVFAFAASYHRVWYKRLLGVLFRACAVAVITFGIFYVEFCGLLACGLYDDFIIVDFLSWTLMIYAIVYGSTLNSRIKPQSKKVILLGCAFGLLGAICWNLIGMEETIPQLFTSVVIETILNICIGCIIARKLPASDHSFLHVEGEIKEMDIALYKWLKQSDDAVVTIGRSVDCSLQLSWDTKSNLAPVHAEICQRKGAVLLTAVDGDVFMHGRAINEGKWIHLYHGDTFKIGTTTFTYIEM